MDGLMQLPTTRTHAFWASLVALLVLAGFAAAWPVSGIPLPPVEPFLPIFSTLVFGTEGLTAAMLCVQFLIFRQPFLGLLGGAYGFVMVADVIQLLVFPGIFSKTGLLGAGAQSAVWIWVFWHGGFALLVLLATWSRRHFSGIALERGRARWLAPLLVGGPMLLSGGLCYLAIVDGGRWLPDMLSGTSYARLASSPAAIAVIAANLIALATVFLASRARTVLELWLCVALLAANCDVIMTLTAGARGTLGWYAARCLSVVSAAAVLSMLFWEINRLYHNLNAAHLQLTEFSIRDGLTGIYNRRHFDEYFAREVARARRTGQPLSILMADVDWFKRYNDTLGHQQGDACLIAVAQALARQSRGNGDLVARYGGEEFVIVLPATDRDSASAISEKLRQAVTSLHIAAPRDAATVGHQPDIVTLSIGAATLSSSGDARSLLAAADRALYMAKNAGRNRVCFASADALPV